MVHWRVSSGFSILLRVHKHPSQLPRSVNQSSSPAASTTPQPPSSLQNNKRSELSRDEEQHDPNIDLITLRRRVPLSGIKEHQSGQLKTESSTSQAAPQPDLSPTVRIPSNSDDLLPQPQHPTHSESQQHVDDNPEKSKPTRASHVLHSLSEKENPRVSTSIKTGSDFKPTNMDPYLMQYLKNVDSPSTTPRQQSKSPLILEGKPSREDLDLDALRPIDIRRYC